LEKNYSQKEQNLTGRIAQLKTELGARDYEVSRGKVEEGKEGREGIERTVE
jgi:hypothetical protein